MNYFTKEIKIALTAIAAVVLLFFGIYFMKGINLFQKSNLYYVSFADIAGLTVSNPVYADGYAVGIVRTIEYDYNHPQHVVVGVEVDEEMRIPTGTRAELESEMLGGVKMNLVLAHNPLKHLERGDTIQGGLHNGAIEKVSAMVPAFERMLPKLDSILTSINTLLADPALSASMHNVRDITANLKVSTAQLNTLLYNDVPQLTEHFNRVGANMETVTGKLAKVDVEGTMARINGTLDNVQQFTATLRAKTQSKDNTLGLMLNDRSVYDRMNHTMGSADSLLLDLRAHPKRYVHFSVFGKKDK